MNARDSKTFLLPKEDKIRFVAGINFMYTVSFEKYGISSLRMSDGPHGLRVQKGTGDNGVTSSLPATCFPTAVTVASSWNVENAYSIGQAIGEEAHHFKIHVVLGPGANIKRAPLGGRNFEYFSEDPYLSGLMAGNEILGIERKGVAACIKHFALNNSENFRNNGDSIVDERTMHELYLRSFQKAIEIGHPAAIMSAYNKVNGVYCSENSYLLREILQEKWGFNGLVMTDWGAMHSRKKSLEAGCHLEMPGDTLVCQEELQYSLNHGFLKEEVLDEACYRLLSMIQKYQKDYPDDCDFKKHYDLSVKVATDSAVLLKNESYLLPLNEKKKYLVIGDLFQKMRYQGAGSSMILPYFLKTPKDAFDQKGVCYAYCRGYQETGEREDTLFSEAINAAKEATEPILFFGGLTDLIESEGVDRENMSLPMNQIKLLNELIRLGKKIVFVLFGGSPVELPFIDGIDALLSMFLPGEGGGEACYNLLFGKANPSGHLSESWPLSYHDVVCHQTYSLSPNEVYQEGILVGYRYYLNANIPTRYPFGYGLSYSKFLWSDFSLEQKEDKILLFLKVKNIGEYPGADVVQIYSSSPNDKIYQSKRDLRAFCKVYLKPKEEKFVSLSFPINDLASYHLKEHRFLLLNGKYKIIFAHHAEDTSYEEEITIKGEEVSSPYSQNLLDLYNFGRIREITPSMLEEELPIKIPTSRKIKPYTLDSKLHDFKYSFFGNILRLAVLSMAKKQYRKAKKLPLGVQRDNQIKGAIFLYRILENNTLNSMSMCAQNRFPYHFARGFCDVANGHFFKAIKHFCSKKNFMDEE